MYNLMFWKYIHLYVDRFYLYYYRGRYGREFGLTPSIRVAGFLGECFVQTVEFYRLSSWTASADGSSSVAVRRCVAWHRDVLQQQTITITHIGALNYFTAGNPALFLCVLCFYMWCVCIQVLRILILSQSKHTSKPFISFIPLVYIPEKIRYVNGISSHCERWWLSDAGRFSSAPEKFICGCFQPYLCFIPKDYISKLFL